MLRRAESKNSLKTLKFRNRRLVLSFMRGTAAVSVNDISRATGLSKMTVHKIIDHYLKEGMIAYAGKGVSTEEGGKKPNLFSFNADCRYIFVIRFGYEFIATAVVNLKGEMVVEGRKMALESATYQDAIYLVAGLFTQQMEQGGLSPEDCMAVVVGCDGIVDCENGACLATFQHPTWGNTLPLRESLESILPQGIPISVDSWWRHLAYSEMHTREEGGRKRFFLIGNSGDYISGGLVCDGGVYSGTTGFAGETGHMIVRPGEGPECVCGGRGCLESIIAPGRVLDYIEAGRAEHPGSSLFQGELQREGLISRVTEAAEKGDAFASAVCDRITSALAVAINNIIFVCDPGSIVLFGDYAAAGEPFLGRLQSAVDTLTLRGVDKRTHIEYSSMVGQDGVVGAATRITDALFSGER